MTQDEKAKAVKSLAMMFNCFPQSALVDVDLQMEAYMFVVSDFEFRDVEQAILRIIEGGEGQENRTFIPSTAELCGEVRRRKEMRELLAKRADSAEITFVKSAETF